MCLLSLVGDQDQHSVVEQVVKISTSALKKESYLSHIGVFHCAHVGKSIPWITIGCWFMHGHISIYKYNQKLIYIYIYIYIYIPAFDLVVLQELYWVTGCFIFVYQLDTSWDPGASKCYCHRCCYSTMLKA